MNNKYNLFSDISQVPTRYKTLVVTRDDADPTTIIFTPMWHGKQAGEETTFGAADVDIDPLAGITKKTRIYVQDDIEGLFQYVQKFSEIFRENNGCIDAIGEALEQLNEELALQIQFEIENNQSL